MAVRFIATMSRSDQKKENPKHKFSHSFSLLYRKISPTPQPPNPQPPTKHVPSKAKAAIKTMGKATRAPRAHCRQ